MTQKPKDGYAFMHQILAVTQGMRQAAEKLVKKLITDFQKRSRYEGLEIVTTWKSEKRAVRPMESKEVGHTVDEEFNWILPEIAEIIDATITKNEGNAGNDSTVRAEIELPDGVKFGPFGGITLLDLEKNLTAVRPLFEAIPVLDQSYDWGSSDKGKGILKTKSPQTTNVTEKVPTKFVAESIKGTKGELTEKFTREFLDETVGHKATTRFASMVTPAEKSAVLKRLDVLLIATRKALALANQGEIEQKHEVGKMLDYVIGKKKK